MIDFSERTKAAILAEMLARIPDIYDKRDTSPISTALAPAAYQLEGVYEALTRLQLQSFLETAVGADLDLIAAIGGVTRLGATPAVRLGVFNIPVYAGARFSTIAGSDSINFTVTAATEDPLQWWLTSETPGEIGNQYSGPILPISTIPGLTSAQLTSIIVDGSDPETDDALRARLVTALTDKPFAGNIAAYRKYFLELTEVTALDGSSVAVKLGGVQVYPVWNGGGTVKVSVLGSDHLPITQELLALLQMNADPVPAMGEGFAPIGAELTVDTATPLTVNVSATVAHTAGTPMDAIQLAVEEAIEAYFNEIRTDWGVAEATDPEIYISWVYLARVLTAIFSVTGVTNVTNVRLNGSAADISLTETSALQQVPVLGTVTLTEG